MTFTKVNTIISFLAGSLTIFAFATGIQKISDWKYQKKLDEILVEEKRIEFKSLCQKNKKGECFIIYTDNAFTSLENNSIKDLLIHGEAYRICEPVPSEYGDVSYKYYIDHPSYQNLTVYSKDKNLLGLSKIDSYTFILGDVKFDTISNIKYNTKDKGFQVAELHLSGIINKDKRQYLAHLFAKVPIGSKGNITYYGFAYFE